jgi:hypothetical protein
MTGTETFRFNGQTGMSSGTELTSMVATPASIPLDFFFGDLHTSCEI